MIPRKSIVRLFFSCSNAHDDEHFEFFIKRSTCAFAGCFDTLQRLMIDMTWTPVAYVKVDVGR
jgi:hypothetical protein